MRICAAGGCTEPVTITTRTLCSPHFQRWLAGKSDDDKTADMRYVPLEVRFWRRVDKTPTCWLWTGPLFEGYGRIKLHGKAWPAHRMAWTMLRGPIPEGMQIDHKCRTRACVNPDHLQTVTHALNQQNRSQQGWGRSGHRGVSWSKHHNAWHVRVGDGSGGRISIGLFKDLEEAKAVAIEARNRIMTNNLEDRRAA